MKSLLVCNDEPWKKFGGAMRIGIIGEALADFGPTDLLLLRLPPDSIDRPPFRHAFAFQRCKDGSVRDRMAATRERLADELPQWLTGSSYDLIWYCKERSWLMTRGLLTAPTIIDVDDLEDVVLAQWIRLGEDDLSKPLSEQSYEQMAQEITWWHSVHHLAAQEADALVFSSEMDKSTLRAERSVVVPNTYEGAVTPRSPRVGPPTILFQGLLTWRPNEDAAAWLVTGIAPLIRASIPGLRVILAGAPSNRVQALAAEPMTEVTGEVPDMAPYLDAADLVLTPLRAGGGTRIKILEAFAHRVPVVSTSIGAAGLEVESGVHLEISDTAEGLARQCIRLLANRAEAERLAHAAHDLYQRQYRREHAVKAVHSAVHLALYR